MARQNKRTDHAADTSPDQELESLPFCYTSKVSAVRQDWLIKGILPGGALCMIDGDKGAGKSHVCAAFAAFLCGGQALAGRKAPRPAAVIWGAGEESVSTDSRPKLAAAGCDLDRVIQLGLDSAGRRARQPVLPADLPALESLIAKTGTVLTILDPLASYLSCNLSPADQQGCRAVAVEMQRIAERTKSVILCCRHLAKNQARDAVHAGMGSVAWAAVARAVLRCEEQGADGWERTLSVVRVNRDKPAPPTCYDIVAQAGGTVVKWGPSLGKDEVDLLRSNLDEGQRLEETIAEMLVRRELAKGPRHASEIHQAAEKERVSKSAVWRAAKKIGVVWIRKGYGADGFVEWSLPDATTPPSKGRKLKSKGKKG